MKEQTVNYELITINNTEKKFKSAAKALNFGGNKAKGKYILFVHQDVDLSSKSFLEKLEIILDSINNLGIAGVAGKSESSRFIISNIKEGTPPKYTGIQIDKPVKVQTLDECLFIIPKKVFNKLKFDEKVCDGWHLYAVDYSLSILEIGLDVYVIPTNIYHYSAGESFSSEYYTILKKLIEKHKDNYNWIYTTMGHWNSVYPLTLQIMVNRSIFYWTKLKRKI